MSIRSRIENLERLLGTDYEDGPPGSIPESWLKTDPVTGEPRGPGPGETMAANQRRTWEIARAMLLSVPYVPPCE